MNPCRLKLSRTFVSQAGSGGANFDIHPPIRRRPRGREPVPRYDFAPANLVRFPPPGKRQGYSAPPIHQKDAEKNASGAEKQSVAGGLAERRYRKPSAENRADRADLAEIDRSCELLQDEVERVGRSENDDLP